MTRLLKLFVVAFLFSVPTFFCTAQNTFKAIYSKALTFKGLVNETNITLLYSNGKSQSIYLQEQKSLAKDGFKLQFDYAHSQIDYNLKTEMISQYRVLDDKKTVVKGEYKNDMEWTILNESKKIGKFNCQKAEGEFINYFNGKRKKVTAWFTNDIPISTGPLRYVGLPGLVVQVQVSKGQLIKLASISYKSTENFTTYKNAIEVSKKEAQFPNSIDRKWLKAQKKKYR